MKTENKKTIGKPVNQKRREIIVKLRDDENLSFAKIGEALGVSKQCVYTTYVRAKNVKQIIHSL